MSSNGLSSNATLDPSTPPSQWSRADGRVACLDQACRGTGACASLDSNGITASKWLVNQVKPYAAPDAAFLTALVQVSVCAVVGILWSDCHALCGALHVLPPGCILLVVQRATYAEGKSS